MNKLRNKLHRLGPGGMDCPCCGPAPKHKKASMRLARRRLNQFYKQETNDELIHIEAKGEQELA